MPLGDTYSVKCRLEAVITPVLQGIPDVDGDCALYWVTRVPHASFHGLLGRSALASTYLQTHLPYNRVVE